MSNDRPYGMALNPYRRALMNHPNISDSDGSEPHYMWNSKMGLK